MFGHYEAGAHAGNTDPYEQCRWHVASDCPIRALVNEAGLGDVSATAMLVATIASFFTLSLLIWLMTLSSILNI